MQSKLPNAFVPCLNTAHVLMISGWEFEAQQAAEQVPLHTSSPSRITERQLCTESLVTLFLKRKPAGGFFC